MLNIAVIAGGDSGEYSISMKSGQQVELNLDRTKYQPWLIEVRGKDWFCHRDGKDLPVDKNDFSLLSGGNKIIFDAVFNAIHGTPGEDGRLQGYFDALGIPYTSSGVTTSALTFNKDFCKKVVAAYGVRMAKSIHLFRNTPDPGSLIRKELTLPLFVKPNNGGSSVGMSKVNKTEEINAALEKAFKEDPGILVEEFIPGRELTCGVIGSGGEVIAFPVTEIISKKEFFDYEAKYHSELAEEVCPARVPDSIAKEVQRIAKDLFGKLNCAGVVRFDFILHGEDLYFLEVNTVPGLTNESIVPKMAKAYGWTMQELFTRMIEECMKSNRK
jgi:D-alanine-D-alanine ligase